MSGKICVRNLLKIAAGIFLGMNGAFRNRLRFFIFDDSRIKGLIQQQTRVNDSSTDPSFTI